MNEKKDVNKLLELIEPKMQEAENIFKRLALLEVETNVKKTQLNQIKASISKCLDECDVESFSTEDQSMITELIHKKDSFESLSELEQLEVYKTYKELEDVKDWKLNISLDEPKLLKIQVSYPNGHSEVIDIVKSIEKNYESIGHPLILKAIGRYRSVLLSKKLTEQVETPLQNSSNPLTSEKALYCLNKIKNVLTQVPELSSDDEFFKMIAMGHRHKYGTEYFQKIVEHLNSTAVKRHITISNKIMHLKRGLKKEFPLLEYKEILSWLSERLDNKKCLKDSKDTDLLIP